MRCQASRPPASRASRVKFIRGSRQRADLNKVMTLKTRDEILGVLQANLQQTQEGMRKDADRRRTDRKFEEEDWVYLRLQPYKQQTVAQRQNMKLSPRFYGSFQVLEKVGKVAYRLDLPLSSKIPPVFHVSCLKEKLEQRHRLVVTLPPKDKKKGQSA